MLHTSENGRRRGPAECQDRTDDILMQGPHTSSSIYARLSQPDPDVDATVRGKWKALNLQKTWHRRSTENGWSPNTAGGASPPTPDFHCVPLQPSHPEPISMNAFNFLETLPPATLERLIICL
ncbi:unnamed protein product [Phytophthora fragariaefolia]|uniref:Unnamed protein product n=1 Tax=Phytophthora fragariaefolia TaxID=1490495 RepID=A0A9W7DBU6_9STRA|nr:unnamed protein product [Phytophthora fragariaefolia]